MDTGTLLASIFIKNAPFNGAFFLVGVTEMVLVYFPTASYGRACARRASAKTFLQFASVTYSIMRLNDELMTKSASGFMLRLAPRTSCAMQELKENLHG